MADERPGVGPAHLHEALEHDVPPLAPNINAAELEEHIQGLLRRLDRIRHEMTVGPRDYDQLIVLDQISDELDQAFRAEAVMREAKPEPEA
jgi:hypothetical protein